METKTKNTKIDSTSMHYRDTFEYLQSQYDLEKRRYENFNIRTNWILVFMGVLIMPIKFFWVNEYVPTTKCVLSLIFLTLVISLIFAVVLMCLYTMIPKTTFNTTDYRKFLVKDYVDYMKHSDKDFYETMISHVASHIEPYYLENERKGKMIKRIYIMSGLIVICFVVLAVLKF